MKLGLVKTLRNVTLGAVAATMLVSCGGTTGGGSSSSWGYYGNPYITSTEFVDALNGYDGNYFPYDSFVAKDTWETIRGEGFFVYFDEEVGQYIAVDIDYLQSLSYWSTFSSNRQLAAKWRDIVEDETFFGDPVGDGYGDRSEEVDYAFPDVFGTDVYQGFDSGLYYNDEAQTTDTTLMAARVQKDKLDKKAFQIMANTGIVSHKAYEVAKLGNQLENIISKTEGDVLAQKDQEFLAQSMEKLLGVSADRFQQAAEDQEARTAVLSDIAAEFQVEVNHIEDVVLPELLPSLDI